MRLRRDAGQGDFVPFLEQASPAGRRAGVTALEKKRRDAGQGASAAQQETTSRLCTVGKCHFVGLCMWSSGGAANPRTNKLRTHPVTARPCEAPVGGTLSPVPRCGGAGGVQRGRPRCGTMLDAPSGPLCFFLRAEKEEATIKSPWKSLHTLGGHSLHNRRESRRKCGCAATRSKSQLPPHISTPPVYALSGDVFLLACACGVPGARLIRAPTN